MEWAHRIAADKGIDGTDRLVLLALAYHAGSKSGRTWVAVDTLAAELHVDPRTITRALGRIEKLGILEVTRRRGWTTVWVFPADARWTPVTTVHYPRHRSPLPPSRVTGDQGVSMRDQREPSPADYYEGLPGKLDVAGYVARIKRGEVLQ